MCVTHQANFKYVPIASDVVPLIASLVAPAPAAARFIDICAGEGEAAAQMASAWGIGRDQLYLNELADGRMARCTRFTDHVLGADAIRALQISRNTFQIAWTTPPSASNRRSRAAGGWSHSSSSASSRRAAGSSRAAST